MKAAALNFPDVLIIQGKYQFQPQIPFVPGGESSGIVIEIGAKVKNIKVGDEVVAFDLVGAFAEENVVDASRVMPKPKALSFEQGAAICETYFTTYHAYVQRAALTPGETVLVLGAAGGVGSTAIELAKAMGANVIAAASTDEKLEFTRSLGADHVINYKTTNLKDAVKDITQGKGVDVVYDPVGGDLSELAVRSMAWKGRYLVVGFAAGKIPSIPLPTYSGASKQKHQHRHICKRCNHGGLCVLDRVGGLQLLSLSGPHIRWWCVLMCNLWI